MIEFDDFLKEQMQDKEFKSKYDALDSEFSSIQAEITARKNAKLTQKNVMKKPILLSKLIRKIGNDCVLPPDWNTENFLKNINLFCIILIFLILFTGLVLLKTGSRL